MNKISDNISSLPISYTINDACRVSGIGRTKMYALIGEGSIKVTKIGKRTLINASSLRQLVTGEA